MAAEPAGDTPATTAAGFIHHQRLTIHEGFNLNGIPEKGAVRTVDTSAFDRGSLSKIILSQFAGRQLPPQKMTPKQALRFVNTNGIALESGRGPVPSLAETVAGKPIRGSWWKHPKGNIIFQCSRAIRSSREVLVCRLVEGKVSYVHRRLWSALVRLADQFDPDRLAAIREIHTASGKHKVEVTAYPKWVPSDVMSTAAKLSIDQAAAALPIPLERFVGEAKSSERVNSKL